MWDQQGLGWWDGAPLGDVQKNRDTQEVEVEEDELTAVWGLRK